MKIKFYSELTDTTYDSKKELLDAEEKFNALEKDKQDSLAEIKGNYEKYKKAQEEFGKSIENYVKKFEDDGEDLLDMIDSMEDNSDDEDELDNEDNTISLKDVLDSIVFLGLLA